MPPKIFGGKGEREKGKGAEAKPASASCHKSSDRNKRKKVIEDSESLSPFPLSSSPLSPFAFRLSPFASVAVIGAGRLGTALARALAARGYHIKTLVSRRAASARRACLFVDPLADTPPAALKFSDMERLPPVDLFLITTPDDAIEETAMRLGEVLGASKRRRIALHASGALSSDVMGSLRVCGCAVGSMHPLVSVSDPVAGAEALGGAFYCVEGDRPATGMARRLVRDLGGHSFTIKARDKALYHAAAVMTSGHSVALFDAATELLARCGLSQMQARRVLLPLLGSTYKNLSSQKLSYALTGTFARGDVATVRRHLAALQSQSLSDTLAIYTLLGQRSLQLATENGQQSDNLKEIALLLEKAVGSRR